MKPSSSSGSQSSFIRPLASSLVSFSQVGEETEQLISNHRIVIIFVIELKDFNKVMESPLVLGILACLVHWVNLSFGECLLPLLCLSSNLINSLECWVQVTGTDEVTRIEGINSAISLEVIDVKSKLNCINFLLLKSKLSHCYYYSCCSFNW